MQEKKGRMTLVNRLIMFVLVFCLMLIFQSGIGSYQEHRVLKPMEQRTANIQVISQFLNNLEQSLSASAANSGMPSVSPRTMGLKPQSVRMSASSSLEN